jgi:hypothetical protein
MVVRPSVVHAMQVACYDRHNRLAAGALLDCQSENVTTQQLRRPLQHDPALRGAQVNGDSGNDAELFTVPGVRGCCVANAHAELRTFCEAHASPNIFMVCASLGPWLSQQKAL